MCGVFASTSPFTVSNFWAISLARFLWCGCLSLVTESFANLKLVKIGQLGVFFF